MKKWLIVNADDYCRTPEVSRGIRKAHKDGIVSSTTCMMNYPQAVDDIHKAKEEAPGLGLGVHLVLTSGKPVLPAEKVPSLVTPEGDFHQLGFLKSQTKLLVSQDVYIEWDAQISRFIESSGQMPTHLDSHHHVSYFTEGLFELMLELARRYNCAIRFPTAKDGKTFEGLPDEFQLEYREYAPRLVKKFGIAHPEVFISDFYDEKAGLTTALKVLETLPVGVSEMMCHPGYIDEDLALTSAYNYQREIELEVLCNPQLRSAAQRQEVQFVTFKEIK